VHRLRNEKRADIVGLMLEEPSGCGVSTRVGAGAEDAYFVVHHSCAALTISIAHEVGHILGARHDRSIDALDTPFPYGHGYVNGAKWRDIMSYHGLRRMPTHSVLVESAGDVSWRADGNGDRGQRARHTRAGRTRRGIQMTP
jgi:hypothetical protein